MAVDPKQAGGRDGAEGGEGGRAASHDSNEVIVLDDDEDDEDPIAGFDEDDVVLHRPNRIVSEEVGQDSTATSRVNSPALPYPSAISSSSSAPPPSTISPSLLQPPQPSKPLIPQATNQRIQTLVSSSHPSNKSKSPSPAPDDPASPSSATPSSASVTLPQSSYRPLLSDDLIAKAPVPTANKLIALLAPPAPNPQPSIPASDRTEILRAMNSSGNNRYYAAWVDHKEGLNVLAGWMKGLAGKKSETWKKTAVPLLEVVQKLEISATILTNGSYPVPKYLRLIVKNEGFSDKVHALAQAITASYAKTLGLTPDETSNKKRKVEPSTNGSSSSLQPASSSATKPSSSSSVAAKSSSSTAKPLASTFKPATKVPASKLTGPAAKTDTSWFGKTKPPAPVVKKPTTTPTSMLSTTTTKLKPLVSSSSNVFQQAVALTGSGSGGAGSTLGKRPISSVEGAAASGGKRVKTITWRDQVKPQLGLEDVKIFQKQGWEIQFEGTHDQTVAQLDQDEGLLMKGHRQDFAVGQDIEDDMVDWYEPNLLFMSPEMLSSVFRPTYTGLHASEQASHDATTLEAMYIRPSDIPESPAEADRVVEDGPETRMYEHVDEAPPPPPPAPPQFYVPTQQPAAPSPAPPGVLPPGLDIAGILAQLDKKGGAAAPGFPQQQQQQLPYGSYPPPPSDYNVYNPSSSSSSSNAYGHAPQYPPSSSSNPHLNRGQPGPSSNQQDSYGYNSKRKAGPDDGGQRKRQDSNGGGNGNGNGNGGRNGGGKMNVRCKFYATQQGCVKGASCPFRH